VWKENAILADGVSFHTLRIKLTQNMVLMQRRIMERRTVQSGFTLIELLVVVAIIAVLVAILLPAMAQARVNAQSAVCKSNQHQIHGMVMNYALGNADFLPPAYDPFLGGSYDPWGEYRLDYHWCSLLLKDSTGIQPTWDVEGSGGSTWALFSCPITRPERRARGGVFSVVGYVYSWMVHNSYRVQEGTRWLGKIGRDSDEKRVLIHDTGVPKASPYLITVGAPYCGWMDWYLDALAIPHNGRTHFLAVGGAVIDVPDLGSNAAYLDGGNRWIVWW
jgi:prepilin-type N-terminal cleavage/methylation domain-containing protein